MLILPLIDLLIVVGTGFLALGFGLKALDITTTLHPTILGFSSIDFVVMTGICWGFALTLAARSWVKINEPRLLERRREILHAQAQQRIAEYELANGPARAEEAEAEEELAPRAVAGDSR